MARIDQIERNTNAKTRELWETVQKQMGTVPNMVATMAQSPAVVRAYLDGVRDLAGGSLPNTLRQQISLVVSEANQCDYCVSAHTFFGNKAGLNESDLLDARHGTSTNRKTNAALTFARKIIEDRGHVSDEDLEQVRQAGYTEGEIVEIIANVCMTTFTNYFNQVAATEVDYPYVPLLVAV
ncbi:MAG: carboxymuconolactone decarboxylase family protein [Thermoguttaceae bacterium]